MRDATRSLKRKKPDGEEEEEEKESDGEEEEEWTTEELRYLDFVKKVKERDSSESKKGMYKPFSELLVKYDNGILRSGEVKREIAVVLGEHDDLKRWFSSFVEAFPAESRELLKETYCSDRNTENPTPSLTPKKPDGEEEEEEEEEEERTTEKQRSVDFVNMIIERDSSASKKGMYKPSLELLVKYKNGILSTGEVKREIDVLFGEHDDLKRAFSSFIDESSTLSRELLKETYQSDPNMENPTPSYYKLPGMKLGKQNDEVLNDELVSFVTKAAKRLKRTKEEINMFKEEDGLLDRDLHLESLKSAISYWEDVLSGKIEAEKGKIPLKHCQLIDKVYKRRGVAMVRSLKDDHVNALRVILPKLKLEQQEVEKLREERIKLLKENSL